MLANLATLMLGLTTALAAALGAANLDPSMAPVGPGDADLPDVDVDGDVDSDADTGHGAVDADPSFDVRDDGAEVGNDGDVGSEHGDAESRSGFGVSGISLPSP